MTNNAPEPDQPRLSERLDEVSDTLDHLLETLDSENLEPVLTRLAQLALWAIECADAVSVTVLDEERPYTAASTASAVLTIDESQYDTGVGPCLEAARTREPVLGSAEDTRLRWPDFADAAKEADIQAFLAAPLVLPAVAEEEGDLVGALNVYSKTVAAFEPIDAALLRLLTSAGAAAIGGARRYLRSAELVGQLRTALASRAEIDQAKGALMAIHGICADEAFARLVDQSQRENVKLAELARTFLTRLRRSETGASGQEI